MADAPNALPRLVAAALVFASLAVACGTRVPESDVRAALAGGDTPGLPDSLPQAPVDPGAASVAEGPGVGSGDAGAGATPASSGGVVALPAGDGSSEGGGSGKGSGNGSKGGGKKKGGGAEDASACTGNPGATDVGVTGGSIEVGATYAESSLIPGQFRPAMDGVQAHLNMVNRERGGVCDRAIEFHFHNDGLNAQKYGENVRHLVEQDQVFAMLGSISAADSGACSYMDGQLPPKGTPDVGTFALNYCRSQHPTFYSPMGSLKPEIYGCCPDWDWLKGQFGYTTPAVHWLDVEISRDQGLAVVDALVRTLGLPGRDGVYQGEHSAAQFSYAGDVQDMASEGVDAVWSSMDLNGNVKLIRAMCQQEWYPKVIHVEISAYDPQLIQRVGPECIGRQNIWMRAFHRAFTSPNEEISRYVSELKAFCPSCEPTTFGLEGWLSAKLFVEVLEAVGPNLTRDAFYQAMNALVDWDGGGVMGPNTPSRRLIYHCNFMIHVRPDGFFQERDLACGEFYASGDYTGPPVGP